MREILEWLKPGARVKRYIFLQILSMAVFIYCVISLQKIYDLNKVTLIAYILLITLSAFGMIFSFILAQKNILYISLKNLSKRNKSIKLKKLLYGDPRLKKGPKVVVIGGGSGLPNLLKGLKEYTSNITAVVNVSDDDLSISSVMTGVEKLTPGDIRKCISALSIEETELDKLLKYKEDENNKNAMSVGNTIISSLIKITGSFSEAVKKASDIFDIRGNIYPVTTDNIILCAGLENGEVVVGKENIIDRVRKMKLPIKQIFLKEGSIKALPEVIDAIKSANVIVIGPGELYTSVASNFLIPEISKAVIKSKAKKVYVSNIMNQPGQTDGYTLARYINEIERYIGKHILDYAIVNSGKITTEIINDFNQGDSTPVRIDLENIQNRAISVIKEDLVMATSGAIIHDSKRLAEIIIRLTKSRKIGDLNIVRIKKKHMLKEKRLILKSKMEKAREEKNKIKKKSKSIKNKNLVKNNIKKEDKINKKTEATIKKIKSKISKG